MVPDGRNPISDLYHAVLARPPGERTAFLMEACGGDEGLRQEIESLLGYESASLRFLETPAAAAIAGALGDAPDRRQMVGRQLGPYTFVAPLGAGGMGEVYRARDSRLGREVAIKILPSAFTSDSERRARFAREAHLLATLNHPHIGAIYGLEETDGITALVLELVEGPTLANRLSRGPLPVSEALAIARQIAGAIDAAHEKGIVHRDLKPANIVVQSAMNAAGVPSGEARAKVLDFGLAKTIAVGLEGDLTQHPSGSLDGTAAGRILGTPAYMSPEQARGQAVDKRTDIWAFGCVLYEMLSGRRAFDGDTISDTLVSILEHEPDWTALPAATPASVRTLIARCLRKDPRKRLHDIADALIELDEGIPPIAARAFTQSWRGRLIAGVLAVALAGLVTWVWQRIGSPSLFVARNSPAVSELLLKGEFYRSRWGEADIRKGIDYYNRAIALDPNVVDAYGGLATAWISLSDLHASPRDAMPRARAAAEEVLRRDDAWPYAHVSLGVIKLQYDWDFAGADREFARAMTLQPDETIGRVLRGWLRMAEGRLPEAQADMQRAVDEVPSEINLWSLGLSFYFAGQYEAAIEQYRRAIAVEPRSYWAHLSLGWAYERQGRVPDAIKELEQTRGLLDTPQVVAGLVHAQAAAGRRVEAQATMASLLEYAKHKYVSPYDLATASAGLGDRTEAMAWLEKAYEDRSGWLALWLKIDPTFDSLRADDRFRDLLTRVGHTP